LLNDEFTAPYWDELMAFVEEERSHTPDPVYPPADEVFRALELTGCHHTRVVIMGQDPYHDAGQAHGLSFSMQCGVRRPQSLVRIHTELRADVDVRTPNHGSLAPWAHRGVLLLNRTLTVRAGPPLTHQGRGWDRFTDKVIEVVARERDPVFLLMGKEAQRTAPGEGAPIAGSANVVEAPHPVHPTFPGSRPFSRVNSRLRELERDEIGWSLDP
jgi:Uracil DNA glycosylase